MNNISFGASFISSTNIPTKKSDKSDLRKVSIVELDKYDTKDVDSLYELSSLWDKDIKKNNNSYNYVNDIITKTYTDTFNIDNSKEHYFAITLQQDKFEKLNPHGILAVSLFTENNSGNELNYIQVRPKDSGFIESAAREFKHIGKTFLNFLKDNFKGKDIFVSSAHNAIGFYLKNDFLPYEASNPWYLHFKGKKLPKI